MDVYSEDSFKNQYVSDLMISIGNRQTYLYTGSLLPLPTFHRPRRDDPGAGWAEGAENAPKAPGVRSHTVQAKKSRKDLLEVFIRRQ